MRAAGPLGFFFPPSSVGTGKVVLCFLFIFIFTWQVGTTRRSLTSRPGNIASASGLCLFGHSATQSLRVRRGGEEGG